MTLAATSSTTPAQTESSGTLTPVQKHFVVRALINGIVIGEPSVRRVCEEALIGWGNAIRPVLEEIAASAGGLENPTARAVATILDQLGSYRLTSRQWGNSVWLGLWRAVHSPQSSVLMTSAGEALGALFPGVASLMIRKALKFDREVIAGACNFLRCIPATGQRPDDDAVLALRQLAASQDAETRLEAHKLLQFFFGADAPEPFSIDPAVIALMTGRPRRSWRNRIDRKVAQIIAPAFIG
jgi:hypothetical protein